MNPSPSALVHGPRRRLSSVALAAVAVAPCLCAQAEKLNGALARQVDGDVIDYLIAPGGERVILRADAETDGVYELYSAAAKGRGRTVRLNDPLPPHADVGGAVTNVFGSGGWDYGASRSGWVVFLLDLEIDGVDELYSVPADGRAAPVRLNGALAPDEGVRRFWILPDGEDVLYVALELGERGLFRVGIEGGDTPEALTPGVVPLEIWLSPDGATAAYTLAAGFPPRAELWSVPTDGGAAPTRLAVTRPPPALGSTGIDRLEISDDGRRAVYRDVLDELGLVDANLHSVMLDGSGPAIRLNRSPLDPNDRYAFDGEDRVLLRDPVNLFSVSLDGTRRVDLTPAGWTPENVAAVPTADGADVVFAVRDGVRGALYRSPIDGAGPAREIAVAETRIRDFRLSPSRVVFTTQGAPTELLTVSLDGGTPLLSNPAPYDEGARDFEVRPGGDELLFLAQPGGTGQVQLYAVPLDASALPRRLNADLIEAGDVERYSVSEDGRLVVYRADQLENEALELFGLPSAGRRVVQYNPPFETGEVVGDVQSFLASPDESHLLYRADQDQDQVFGLYLLSPDGRGPTRSLTSGLDEDSSVYPGYAFTPGAGRVVFLQAAFPGSASGELYSVGVSPSSAPASLDDRGRIYEQELAVDPLGTRVVYRRQRTSFGAFFDLCSARVDGAGQALTLTPPSGNVTTFRITPDGAAAIYRADHDRAGVRELHRVPLDGSAPSRRLHPPLPDTGAVRSFELTPDGRYVVLVADAEVDQQDELYMLESDGSGPPVKRSGPLVAGGDVTDFAVAPDGLSVVYRADQRIDGTFELFGLPVEGGEAAALAPLPDGRRVEADFAASADGRHVVYRADANAPNVFELFVAAVDGSAGPTRLSAPLVDGGDVLAFAVAGDSGRVVYLADSRLDDVNELYSVPLAGGPSTRLSTLSANADVADFRIGPDARTVFFRADARANEVYELYGVPLDGTPPARRVTLRLPGHADVATDFVPLSHGRVLHRVDYEENGVQELYAGYLDRSYRSSERSARR